MNNPFEQPPEIKPEAKEKSEDYKAWKEHFGVAAEMEEEKLAKEQAKEQRFAERLSFLDIKQEERKKEDVERLKNVNEKIEAADAPWVVRVMGEIKKGAGEDWLLKSFNPEDVDALKKTAQEKGYDFVKEGIISSQAKELASEFRIKRDDEKRKEWTDTFYKMGGEKGRKRIEEAAEDLKREREAQIKAGEKKEEIPPEASSPEVKEAQVAEEKREKTHEEIARHLVEHPAEALGIFKKGVGLKLEKACLGFANFWEKTGAKALKGLSLAGEKTVGYPAGELNRAAWTAGEFFEARPGIKRLNNTLQIYAHLERLLQKGELTQEQADQLEKLQEFHIHAARGQWQEIEAFNRWHEHKKRTLEALRTFGSARKKLETWMTGREIETDVKKIRAATRRTREIAEKF